MENKEVKEALYELTIQTDKENVYQDEINGYLHIIQSYVERLEQALDKACEQLEKFDNRLVEYNIGDSNEVMAKEEWKEWCKENAE